MENYMAYEFDTQPFREFDSMMSEYPEGIPQEREILWRIADLYLAAAAALFFVMLLIMRARLGASGQGARYEGFLPIYEDRVGALLNSMHDFLMGGLERDELGLVHEFLEGTRQGAIAAELGAFAVALDASSGEGEDAGADENAGTTITNSLKEHIERRVKAKWIKDVLHAINEVLSIVRGAA